MWTKSISETYNITRRTRTRWQQKKNDFKPGLELKKPRKMVIKDWRKNQCIISTKNWRSNVALLLMRWKGIAVVAMKKEQLINSSFFVLPTHATSS